jgi:putative adhesin
MIASLTAFTLAVLATATHTDTTFAVRTGTRLELNNFAGSIAVQTWTKNAVRVTAEHSSHVGIEIENSGPTLDLQAVHWRGIPTTVDYQITVPRWMGLELSGVNTDISVENSEAEVNAQTVQGDVTVTGGTKSVSASSVEGDVRITRASGKIECSSVNAGVSVAESNGQILVSSINGEIVLRAIDSDDVEASTINGGVTYIGSLKDAGSYRFSTHNGEIAVTVPERANATVSVATYNGEFSSSFPVQLKETRRGKRFNFTIGNGSARVELESFQGEIRLRRPGDPERAKHKEKEAWERALKEYEKTKHKNAEEGGQVP